MKTFSYTITDPLGIHARPAGELVKALSSFQSEIKLFKGDQAAEAKGIFGIMGLAVKQGDEIMITAEGPDEEAAIQAAETFLKGHF